MSFFLHVRDKLAFTQSRVVNYFFDGSGYALAKNIESRGKFGLVTRFDIEVRTPSDNGLLLLMVNGVSKRGKERTHFMDSYLVDLHLFRYSKE